MRISSFLTFVGLLLSTVLFAQDNYNNSKFKQLYEELPTPNQFRTASGAPGADYYQQKADYDMKIVLDEKKNTIHGEETITYTNNSPDQLNYLWLQLDQNVRSQTSDTKKIKTNNIKNKMSFGSMKGLHNDFDGGFKIEHVKDKANGDLEYTINNTMMRVEMPRPLKPGGVFSFKVKWWYNINDRMEIGGRSGYEYFEEDDNYLYTIAQFFPRMVAYNDVDGWQHKQFLGRGEFTLSFGDYKVSITVPKDHVVGATGTIQNMTQVMTSEQIRRYNKAKDSDKPIMIITQDEAEKNEADKADGTKTWVFKAMNVRDFGFASSRKFIWDAQGVKLGNRTVMAMSLYPKEGNPLWEQYSTKAVAHTLRVYSKYTFDYPYPVAYSVNAKWIGMEYPMICFNFGRPNDDGTYSARTKYGMIGVIIHEVGHNYFPMIVNSDERQWTWMDEGLNSFCQFLAEQEWEEGYKSRRGPAHKIVDYMKGDKSKISPIMTNSESIHQFGNNAYGKPATALNILRETVMGRELFDYAFKEYSQRWMFKNPTPADFFRTMEDASAVDLDWFWRGWFYTNDHCDISLDNVEWYQINTKDPNIEKPIAKAKAEAAPKGISEIRNAEIKTAMSEDPALKDFYTEQDRFEVNILDEEEYASYVKKLDEEDKGIIDKNYNYYELEFSSPGGLVMPIILQFEFVDGTKEDVHIPAEIWKMGSEKVKKVFPFEKEVATINLDPYLETADVDRGNNHWPPRMEPTRFQLYKDKDRNSENPMQRANRAKEREEELKKEKEEDKGE